MEGPTQAIHIREKPHNVLPVRQIRPPSINLLDRTVPDVMQLVRRHRFRSLHLPRFAAAGAGGVGNSFPLGGLRFHVLSRRGRREEKKRLFSVAAAAVEQVPEPPPLGRSGGVALLASIGRGGGGPWRPDAVGSRGERFELVAPGSGGRRRRRFPVVDEELAQGDTDGRGRRIRPPALALLLRLLKPEIAIEDGEHGTNLTISEDLIGGDRRRVRIPHNESELEIIVIRIRTVALFFPTFFLRFPFGFLLLQTLSFPDLARRRSRRRSIDPLIRRNQRKVVLFLLRSELADYPGGDLLQPITRVEQRQKKTTTWKKKNVFGRFWIWRASFWWYLCVWEGGREEGGGGVPIGTGFGEWKVPPLLHHYPPGADRDFHLLDVTRRSGPCRRNKSSRVFMHRLKSELTGSDRVMSRKRVEEEAEALTHRDSRGGNNIWETSISF
ncbi:hypothetical protein H6P81_009918 [Aristolochia fimbriata]|uniref:Uncharacterized protein n=1 Tax=Aristolochia fimbriata TaxID=158543 RepID=A0AAV7EME8_ARIFI|nr:hypothetical protein H6P81_009918 [Aristolochia fimbriata]